MFSKIGKSDYFIQWIEDRYTNIKIHNFQQIWFVEFTKTNLMDLLLVLNKNLEINSEVLFMRVKHMLSEEPQNINRADIKFNEGGGINVNLIQIIGYPLRVSFDLQLGSPEMFFEYVTSQLLQTIHDLKASETDLMNLVKKKDREIEEYKLEGGKLFLKYLKTPPFDLEEHQRLHPKFSEVFKATDVLEDVMQVASRKRIKQEVVKSDDDRQIDRPAAAALTSEAPAIVVKQEDVKTEVHGDVPSDVAEAIDMPPPPEAAGALGASVSADKAGIRKDIRKRKFLNL